MKAFLFLIFFIPSIVFAQLQIQFQDLSFAQALAKSKVEKRPVFLMLFASWCDHCKYMKEQVFTDSAVAAFFNQHFISIKIDAEKDEGIGLAKQFAVKSFPTLAFLDSNGTTLYRIVGQWDVDDFLVQAKNALTPEMQFPYLKQQFESDKSDPNKCYPYIRSLRRANMDVQQVANEYFVTQSEDQLISDMNWKILANGEFDMTSREFKFLVNHQKEFAAITSPERVERKLIGTAAEVLQPFVNNNDTAGYFRKRAGAAAIHNYRVDSLLFSMDVTLYENVANWNAYQKVTMLSTRQYVWNDYLQLKNICNKYLLNISDPGALALAATWAKRALELHEDYSNYLLCARILQKSGDRRNALQMAQEAVNVATKNGWNDDEAEQLVKQMQ